MTTPVYGLRYLVPGEPARNTRAVMQANAESIEAALINRGIPPADLPALIAAGWFGDTGWVNATIRSGFVRQASTNPAARKLSRVVHLRWGIAATVSGAAMAANTTYTVMDVPAGMFPQVERFGVATANTPAAMGRWRVLVDGSVQLLTGATVGTYYLLDSMTPWPAA